MEGGALESDLYDVVSSWLVCKDSIPEGWNGTTKPINPMTYSEIQSLGAKGCSDLLFRARKTVSRLGSLVRILSELTSAIQTEFQAAQSNLKVVKNMCGLASLPNELLIRVFEHAVNRDASLSNPARWKAAVTLSHVCQCFRDAALSYPHLWVNISRSGEMAASCLPRSMELPLDVELRVGFGTRAHQPPDLFFEQLLFGVIVHSKRWRSLGVQFAPENTNGAVNRMIGGSDVRQEFRNLDLPLLESLHIKNTNIKFLCKSYRELAQWNTPSLRQITTIHYFPLSLPSLVNVTTLDITIILDQIDFADLLKDLSRMRVLNNLSLKLDPCLGRTHDPIFPQSYERTELPSVRHLKVEMENVPFSNSSSLKYSLFSSLFFPGAIDLHIRLWGNKHGLGEDALCMFRDVEQFARVERFHFEVYGPEGRGSLALRAWPPLDLIPRLKHFTVQTNTPLVLTRDSPIGRDGYEPLIFPGYFYPSLETITLDVIESSCIGNWIGELLREQKERGEWEEFRELLVKEKRSGVMNKYVGDAAISWCENAAKNPFV